MNLEGSLTGMETHLAWPKMNSQAPLAQMAWAVLMAWRLQAPCSRPAQIAKPRLLRLGMLTTCTLIAEHICFTSDPMPLMR